MSAAGTICPIDETKRHYWSHDVCLSCGVALTGATASDCYSAPEDEDED